MQLLEKCFLIKLFNLGKRTNKTKTREKKQKKKIIKFEEIYFERDFPQNLLKYK